MATSARACSAVSSANAAMNRGQSQAVVHGLVRFFDIEAVQRAFFRQIEEEFGDLQLRLSGIVVPGRRCALVGVSQQAMIQTFGRSCPTSRLPRAAQLFAPPPACACQVQLKNRTLANPGTCVRSQSTASAGASLSQALGDCLLRCVCLVLLDAFPYSSLQSDRRRYRASVFVLYHHIGTVQLDDGIYAVLVAGPLRLQQTDAVSVCHSTLVVLLFRIPNSI